MNRSIRSLAVVALAISWSAAQAQEVALERQVDAATAVKPVIASQTLDGVVVTGSGNPMLRSDQRLAMLNASLPLDTSGSAAESTALHRLAMLFPQSPNAAVGEPRRMMERSLAPPAGSDPDGNVVAGTQ